MDSLAHLQAQLRPLVGSIVLDGDLLIFPTTESEELYQTSTDLYLTTTAGAFALELQSDGQTPRVWHKPDGDLLTLPRQAGLVSRRLQWQAWFAAADDSHWVHERFALAEFPALHAALQARVEQAFIYAFADDNAPTGIKLVFEHLVIHAVAGPGGNLVRTGELGNYFLYPVREHAV